jgi:hypothetical protein
MQKEVGKAVKDVHGISENRFSLKNFKLFQPKAIIVLTLISVIWVTFNINFWQSKKVIEYDVAVYYSYLPAIFYYKDISQTFLKDSANKEIEKRYFAPTIAPNGNFLFKSTAGMALSYLPFFALSHIYALCCDDEVNGYSEPYHFAVQFSSLFYFILGLYFVSKLLKLFYENKVITATLFFVTFGTNALYYITVGAGMSHAVSFGLIAAFAYYTVQWHRDPSFKLTGAIGLLGGLITFIRPINILVFIFFFLYGISSYQALKEKVKRYYLHKNNIFLIAFLGILVFAPQLFYWKQQSGQYLFNSYVGERFYFLKPKIMEGLFSFRKGWLLYTPIMGFALLGCYQLFKRRSAFFSSILVFLIVFIYATFSWWCWWYGGSFGQRSMIDIYPILAIPFAAFLAKIHEKRILTKVFVYALLVLLLCLNIFQTMQAKWNTIHFDSMTRAAYFDAFLRLTKNPEREKFLQHPDYEKARAGLEEY